MSSSNIKLMKNKNYLIESEHSFRSQTNQLWKTMIKQTENLIKLMEHWKPVMLSTKIWRICMREQREDWTKQSKSTGSINSQLSRN